jgi:peptidoglycan hydrolase-like protein with peptidoglycan-binding domain
MMNERMNEATVRRARRRHATRAVCVAAIATLAWGSTSTSASALPDAVEAPEATTRLVGLSVGSEGTNVRVLQQGLIDAGIPVAGGADGVFGPATKDAVRRFQQAEQLSVTGEVDAVTAAALAGGAADRPTGSVGLAAGVTGDTVKELQRRLSDWGVYVPGGADGVFGPATTRAVTQFQRWNGLEATGAVNEATADKLALGTAASVPTAPEVSTANPYVGLSNGQRGVLVEKLQRALIGAGVSVAGGADGVFGNATRSALSGYQRSVGLPDTGIVDLASAERLRLDSAPSPQPESAPAERDNPYVGLAIGSQGDLVRELQNALQSTGLVVSGGADGVFGGATASALKSFQSVNGIDQTGVVTARGADLLRLGTGEVGITNPDRQAPGVTLERFPVQGLCFFGDTWHAARGGGRLHEGVDVIAAEGKFLYAVADGEITKLFWDQPGALSGNGIRLTEPDGTYFIYLHMLGFAPGIEVGTKVKAGDVIGFVGNTGSSATAHLHFEIHPGGGAAVNPYPYIKAIDDCSNTAQQYQASFD